MKWVLVSADLATIAYIAAQVVRWNRDRWSISESVSRTLWSLASALLWSHVLSAFALEHNWSHSAAWESTARRTASAVGWNSGVGILFNEVLLVWWTLDVLGYWWKPLWSLVDSPWWKRGLEIDLAFMFFNAACLFVPSERRWFGGVAFFVLGMGWFFGHRRARE